MDKMRVFAFSWASCVELFYKIIGVHRLQQDWINWVAGGRERERHYSIFRGLV